MTDTAARLPYWEGRKIPMWAPCTDGAEDLICPCGNSVMSGGFQPIGMSDHIAYNTEAPVGELDSRLWGIIECQDCLTVFDNDQMIVPYNKAPNFQPLPWMRVADVDEYVHRIRILWLGQHAKMRVARYFPKDSSASLDRRGGHG